MNTKPKAQSDSAERTAGEGMESEDQGPVEKARSFDASKSMFALQGTHRQILAELQEIDRKVAENAGVYPDGLAEREEELEDALFSIEGTLEEKYRRYGHVMSELRADAESLRARADEYQQIVDRIRKRADRNEDRAKKMENRILEDMKTRQIEEVDTGDFIFKLHWKSGRSVNVLSPPDKLPDRFRREKVDFKYSAAEVDPDVRDLLRDLATTVSNATGKSIEVTPYPDKRAIKSALKEGDEEAEGVAQLEEKKRKLKIE